MTLTQLGRKLQGSYGRALKGRGAAQDHRSGKGEEENDNGII